MARGGQGSGRRYAEAHLSGRAMREAPTGRTIFSRYLPRFKRGYLLPRGEEIPDARVLCAGAVGRPGTLALHRLLGEDHAHQVEREQVSVDQRQQPDLVPRLELVTLDLAQLLLVDHLEA